jgi:hypothetical protein
MAKVKGKKTTLKGKGILFSGEIGYTPENRDRTVPISCPKNKQEP